MGSGRPVRVSFLMALLTTGTPAANRPMTRHLTVSVAKHASPAAALRYQHATDDRDRVIADAMAGLAPLAPVVPISSQSGTGVARRTPSDEIA